MLWCWNVLHKSAVRQRISGHSQDSYTSDSVSLCQQRMVPLYARSMRLSCCRLYVHCTAKINAIEHKHKCWLHKQVTSLAQAHTINSPHRVHTHRGVTHCKMRSLLICTTITRGLRLIWPFVCFLFSLRVRKHTYAIQNQPVVPLHTVQSPNGTTVGNSLFLVAQHCLCTDEVKRFHCRLNF